MSNPEITVIIPTRNRAERLNDCLKSLTQQKRDVPFEIIVVDNGSSDGTPQLLGRWSLEIENLRVVNEPSPGLSRAKNAGIRAAGGRMLLFTDDDVIVGETWVASFRTLLETLSGGLVVAGGPVAAVPDDLMEWPRWLGPRSQRHLPGLDHGTRRKLLDFEYVWGANMAANAHVFEEVGLWDTALGRRENERGTYEDTEFQDRVRGAGGSVWFCPEAAIEHRVAQTAISPQLVISRAYNRGTNDHWRRVHGSPAPGAEFAESPSPVTGGARLVAYATRWLFWSALFRTFGRPLVFDRATAAGYGTGWIMQSLITGREKSRASRIVRQMTGALRELSGRLVGGSVPDSRD